MSKSNVLNMSGKRLLNAIKREAALVDLEAKVSEADPADRYHLVELANEYDDTAYIRVPADHSNSVMQLISGNSPASQKVLMERPVTIANAVELVRVCRDHFDGSDPRA